MAEKVELPGVFPCMKEYKVNMDSRSLQHGAKWNNSDQCKDLINPTDQSLVLQCSWIHYHFQYSYPWWRFQKSWSLSNLSKGLISAKTCLGSIPWAPVDLYQTSKVTLESCFRGNYSGGAYDVTLWSGIRGSHASKVGFVLLGASNHPLSLIPHLTNWMPTFLIISML